AREDVEKQILRAEAIPRGVLGRQEEGLQKQLAAAVEEQRKAKAVMDGVPQRALEMLGQVSTKTVDGLSLLSREVRAGAEAMKAFRQVMQGNNDQAIGRAIQGFLALVM